MHCGKTPRETAARAIEMVHASDQNDSNNLDIVSILTNVDLQEHARYGFADQGDFFEQVEMFKSGQLYYRVSVPQFAGTRSIV